MLTYAQITEMDRAFHDTANAMQLMELARTEEDRKKARGRYEGARRRYVAAKEGRTAPEIFPRATGEIAMSIGEIP